MADLTKLKDYQKKGSFSTALSQAKKPRANARRKGSGNIANNYLGFDPVTGLEDATESSNLTLLAEVAKVEQKATDMEVAGEAFKRKATAIAKQALVRAETVTHVLQEAEKLGIAQNRENTAVLEFLHRMAIANTKADNTEAYSSLATDSAYTDEVASFSEKVRKLFETREQKAIDFEANRLLSEKMKVIKQQQATLEKWQSGKTSTEDALKAYHALVSEQGRNKDTNDKSIATTVSSYVAKTLGL